MFPDQTVERLPPMQANENGRRGAGRRLKLQEGVETARAREACPTSNPTALSRKRAPERRCEPLWASDPLGAWAYGLRSARRL